LRSLCVSSKLCKAAEQLQRTNRRFIHQRVKVQIRAVKTVRLFSRFVNKEGRQAMSAFCAEAKRTQKWRRGDGMIVRLLTPDQRGLGTHPAIAEG
jgi:hypothetical protein